MTVTVLIHSSVGLHQILPASSFSGKRINEVTHNQEFPAKENHPEEFFRKLTFYSYRFIFVGYAWQAYWPRGEALLSSPR